MHRCYIHPDQWDTQTLPLTPDEEHHLLHVLRIKAGTTIRAFDGQGREAETRLCLSDTSAPPYLEILPQQVEPANNIIPHWILIPAIIKAARMDNLIEKATELGAQEIIPIQTTRCVVRLAPAQARHKTSRWERIAISAAKQCGTPRIPTIAPATHLAGALQQMQTQHIPILLGSLQGNPPPIAKVARAWIARQHSPIAIMTGPEGDFTPQEYAQAETAGCIPVSLGHLTLRAETATIFALSVLQALYAEKMQDNER